MLTQAIQSITDNGFCDPILVREKGKSFEIIDGEHRYLAASRMGLEHVSIMNMGKVADKDAKRMTIQMNLKGDEPSDIRLRDIIVDLDMSLEEMEKHLPLEAMEIQSILGLDDPEFIDVVEDDGGSDHDLSANISIVADLDTASRWRDIMKKSDSLPLDPLIDDRKLAVFSFALALVEERFVAE